MSEEKPTPVTHFFNPRPHIEGWYEQRRVDPETGEPEETPCGAKCTICGQSFKKMCASGLFRNHIINFGNAHAHTDPFTGKPT